MTLEILERSTVMGLRWMSKQKIILDKINITPNSVLEFIQSTIAEDNWPNTSGERKPTREHVKISGNFIIHNKI